MEGSDIESQGDKTETFSDLDLSDLRTFIPTFKFDSENLEIITEPPEYYERIKSMFKKAKRRILVSSLYVGTGTLEIDAIECIEESLKNGCPKAVVVTDYFRGLRGPKNTKTTFQPFIQKFKDRLSLYLYRSSAVKLKNVPSRYGEAIGVHHMKFFVSDDDVIITGANFSTHYFVKRQDRYFFIKNCPELAEFLEEFVEYLSLVSYEVDENGTLTPPVLKISSSKEKLHCREKLFDLLKKYSNNSAEGDTLCHVLLQFPDFDVTIDEDVTKKIFACSTNSSLWIASGYLNFSKENEKLLLSNQCSKINILNSSPATNGWSDAKGMFRLIPYTYSFIESMFLELIAKCDNKNRITLWQYERPEWTFHAKGLWYFSDADALPRFTMIGSPNYGIRSAQRDTEMQFVIYSKNVKFRTKLEDERKHLFKYGNKMTYALVPSCLKHFRSAQKFFFTLIRSYF